MIAPAPTIIGRSLHLVYVSDRIIRRIFPTIPDFLIMLFSSYAKCIVVILAVSVHTGCSRSKSTTSTGAPIASAAPAVSKGSNIVSPDLEAKPDRVSIYLDGLKKFGPPMDAFSDDVFSTVHPTPLPTLVSDRVDVDGESFVPSLKHRMVSYVFSETFSLGAKYELHLYSIRALIDTRMNLYQYHRHYFVNERALTTALIGTKLAAEPIDACRVSYQCEPSIYYVSTNPGHVTVSEKYWQKEVPQDQLFKLVAEILTKLEQLHDLGFVHRYLTMDNIIIEPSVRFNDLAFGALYIDPTTGKHVPETVLEYTDSPWFREWLSPWQLNGKSSSRRDDMFQVAAMLVYVLGQVPFDQSRNPETLEQERFAKVPEIAADFYKYTLTLGFTDRPDYNAWIDKFSK